MEKRGIATERGNLNREIEVANQRLRQLKARISKLQNWLKEETANTEPPTLADVIQGILSRREQTGERSRYGTISNLKAAANMLNFLTANKIMDMAGLEEKVQAIYDKQYSISDNLKKIERRIKTLDEHIRHSGNFKGYRGNKAQYDKLYAQYETLKNAKGFGAGRRAQKALDTANEYYESHRMEITLFEAADRYLRDVLQGHFDIKKLPPITKWSAERDKLTAEQNRINLEYVSLKNEVKEVEKIRRGVENIMRDEIRKEQPTRKRDDMTR